MDPSELDLKATYNRLYEETNYAQAPSDWYEGNTLYPNKIWLTRLYVLWDVLHIYKSMGPIIDIGSGGHIPRTWLEQLGVRTFEVDIAIRSRPHVVGDIRRLPIHSKAIDFVTSFDVLEHLPISDMDSALDEIERITRLGAVVTTAFNPERRKYATVKHQLHLTIKNEDWWRLMFRRHFPIVYQHETYRKLWFLSPVEPRCKLISLAYKA